MHTMNDKKRTAINHLAATANKLGEAAKELRSILEDPEMTRYIGPDASFYLEEINGMLSIDDGEAGLYHLIDLLARREGLDR